MESQITIRKYADADCEQLGGLFYETVHNINARDYTPEQLFAWVKSPTQLLTRRADLLKQYTLTAVADGKIVDFGSATESGCLDMLFVHKDFQGRGVATKLCNEFETHFPVIVIYASITAKPFFEKRGYTVIAEQEAERFGVKLKNYKMQKTISI